MFSIVVVSIYIPTKSTQGLSFFSPLSVVSCYLFVFLMMAILTSGKLHLILIFISMSPVLNDWSPFSYICWAFNVSFEKIFRLSSCFLIGLGCMTLLYILHIDPLLGISFASIFSHLVGCFFCLVRENTAYVFL